MTRHSVAKYHELSVFRIIIDLESNWADTEYIWGVFAWDGEDILWQGSTNTHWGAERQARRAVKKLRKGKSPKQPRTYPEEIYVYP